MLPKKWDIYDVFNQKLTVLEIKRNNGNINTAKMPGLGFLWALLTVSGFFITAVSPQSCSLSRGDNLGPFHLSNAPWRSTVCDETDPQFNLDQLIVSGYVKGRNCKGVDGVEVEIWQAGSNGDYDPVTQPEYSAISWDYEDPAGTRDYTCRARVGTDSTGAFSFTTVLPGYYPGRPRHLHYRVTSQQETSVHQMYFEWDPRGGKISSLTVPTDQIAANVKSAVFNFTIDVDGSYDLSGGGTDDGGDDNTTDQPDGVEKDMTCYSCEFCPDPFDASHSSVRIEQCPPHGCRTWKNTGSTVWSRGCLLTPECQPENAAYTAICCNDSNCNTHTSSATTFSKSACLFVFLLIISAYI